jgi:ABC-type glycerol-3-phosphate transport system permease component
MTRSRVFDVLKYTLLVLVIADTLIPLLWIISIGFRFPDEVLQIVPSRLTLSNIPEAIRQTRYWAGLEFYRMFGNSIFVTTVSIAGIIVVCSLAAFGFSHFRFRGKEIIFIAFLLSFMIPIQVMLIPLFFLMKNLGLLGSLAVLILPYIAFGFPIGVLILRSFFERIPRDIENAAIIDGASDLDIFSRIVFPLAKPAVATVATFSFLTVWNEFLFALVFIRKDSLKTIPLVLNQMSSHPYGKLQYEIYGAMVFLTIIPVLAIFLVFQRWFISGLTAGAIKG